MDEPDNPLEKIELRVNPAFLDGVLGGTILGALSGGLAPICILAAFISASVTSGAMTAVAGEKIVSVRRKEKPYKYVPPAPPINHQRVGYIRARRWQEPFTEEQQARLRELFGE